MKKTSPRPISEEQAIRALGALAQASRLRIFRALVIAGKDGMPAGALATALDIAPSALSFHLKELTHAEMIEARQDGRFVIYTASFAEMNGLLAYLTENCCKNSDSSCEC